MPEAERKEIIESLACVDEVLLTFHGETVTDRSVRAELRTLKPDIFANGGDRRNTDDIPESVVCEELGIEMIFNIGGDKIQSSSWLIEKANETKANNIIL